MIENRQQVGWDLSFWGGGGIVIWSIDETAVENDATQTRVKIVQADGREDLENMVNLGDADDIWVAGKELDDTGFPNTRSRRTGQSTGLRIYDFTPLQTEMQFTIGLSTTPAPTPSLETASPVETASPIETPSPVETPLPTPERTCSPGDTDCCLVRIDTDECPPLVAATTPELGCDCYNYCGYTYL